MEHNCDNPNCNGVKYKEFGDMTLCENEKMAIEAFNAYKEPANPTANN